MSKRQAKEARRLRRQVRAEQAQQHAKSVRRNLFLAAGAIVLAVAAALLPRVWRSASEALRNIPAEGAQSVKAALPADAVRLYAANTSSAEKYAAYFRMYHGGGTGITRLVQRPAALWNYVKHHDILFQANVELLRKFGPERYRVFMEGYDGRPGILNEMRALEQELAYMDDLLLQALSEGPDSPAMETVARTVELGGEGALRAFGVQGRLSRHLAQCRIDGAEKVLLGADITGREPLTAGYLKRLAELALTSVDPTDAQIEEFRLWSRQAQDEDQRARHAHLAQQLKDLPEGTVAVILLGASHSAYGRRHEKTLPQFPLEEAAAQVPGLSFETWEDPCCGRLFEILGGGLTLSADSSVEEIRAVLSKLRAAGR